MIRTALLVVLLSSSAQALNSLCLLPFVAAGPDAEPADIVSIFHSRLLDELGRARITPETIRLILESKDPFTVPDQKDTDLSSLQEKMQAFHGMVVQRMWDTAAVRERLLEDLKRRLDGGVVAQEALKRADENLAPSHEARLPPGGTMMFHPLEDTILVMTDPNAPAQMAYHTKTGRKVDLPPPPKYRFVGTFSADGTEAFISIDGFMIDRVPYKNGILEWDKATRMGDTKNDTRRLSVVLQNPAGTKLYAGTGNLHQPRNVFNLKTGKRIEIDTSEVDKVNGTKKQWGLLPGKDQVFITFTRMDRLFMRTYTIDAKGKMNQVGNEQQLDAPAMSELTWRKQGGGLLAHSAYQVQFAESELHYPIPLLNTWGENITYTIGGVAFHPADKAAIVLLKPEVPTLEPRIEWIDLNSKQITKFATLPKGDYSEVRFLNDGRIFVKGKDSSVIWIPSEKFQPKPPAQK